MHTPFDYSKRSYLQKRFHMKMYMLAVYLNLLLFQRKNEINGKNKNVRNEHVIPWTFCSEISLPKGKWISLLVLYVIIGIFLSVRELSSQSWLHVISQNFFIPSWTRSIGVLRSNTFQAARSVDQQHDDVIRRNVQLKLGKAPWACTTFNFFTYTTLLFSQNRLPPLISLFFNLC